MLEEATLTITTALSAAQGFMRGDYCDQFGMIDGRKMPVRVTKVAGSTVTIRETYPNKLGEAILRRFEDCIVFPASDLKAFVARKLRRQ